MGRRRFHVSGSGSRVRTAGYAKGGRRFRQPPCRLVSGALRPRTIASACCRRRWPCRTGKGERTQPSGRQPAGAACVPVTGRATDPGIGQSAAITFAPPFPFGSGFAEWSIAIELPEGRPIPTSRAARTSPLMPRSTVARHDAEAPRDPRSMPSRSRRIAAACLPSGASATAVAFGRTTASFRPAGRLAALGRRSVSYPPHLLSRAERAVSRGGVPVSPAAVSRWHRQSKIRRKSLTLRQFLFASSSAYRHDALIERESRKHQSITICLLITWITWTVLTRRQVRPHPA